LNPLTRPMAMKAPRQDASTVPSSECTEADRAAAGGNSRGGRAPPKNLFLYNGLYPHAPAIIYQSACHVYPRALLCCSRLTDTLQLGIGGLEKSGFDTDHVK